MPVRKLTLAQAEESLWLEPTDPRHWRRVDAVLRLGSSLGRRRSARGVRKFHDIEEAQRERDSWPSTRT